MFYIFECFLHTMKNKLVFVVAFLIILAVAATFIFKAPVEEETYLTSVTIRQIYRDSLLGEVTKVVYDATGDDDLSAYSEDCARHNGLFQACGNICEPRAAACVEVCAVTCSFPSSEN